MRQSEFVSLHDRTYLLPRQPTVVICVDGFDPTYLAAGIADGILPTLSRLCAHGWHTTTAQVAVPTLTNPNNLSIITGQPTRVHGVAGNFFLDKKTGEEIMIVDDSLVRGSTILEQMSRAGMRVVAITAKDKLRRIISRGLEPGKDIVFSTQFANQTSLKENGIENVEAYVGRPTPSQYSGDLSLYVLDAGIKLLQDRRGDLFYLTLSDFIQHKHAPGSPESNAFLSALDTKVARLIELGAVVGITGDHGMSDKSLPDGTPNVLFVQDKLEAAFGPKCARVICPITDPFVRHHGALGGFARIHVAPAHAGEIAAMIKLIGTFEQVQEVLPGAEAAEKYEMPADREGDIVVISTANAVLGSKQEEHDMSNLKGHRLRSHGGLSERQVPLIMSVPMRPDMQQAAATRLWHNWDAFDLVLNAC